MIISDKYKFIFLHVPKTGGSSVNAFLNQYLGDSDLQLGWPDTLLKGLPYNKRVYKEINNKKGHKLLIEGFKRRAKDQKILEKPIIEYALKQIISKKLGSDSMHAKAKNVKKFVSKKKWNKYFKFCFIRNPYTHAISSWLWDDEKYNLNIKNSYQYKKFLTKKKFNNHLKKIYKKSLINDENVFSRSFLFPGTKIYTIDNEVAVDFIGKFENLEKDLKKICKMIGLPKPKFKLTNVKHKVSSRNIKMKKFFDKENKDLVKKIWKKEFEIFKYKFPY